MLYAGGRLRKPIGFDAIEGRRGSADRGVFHLASTVTERADLLSPQTDRMFFRPHVTAEEGELYLMKRQFAN